MIVGCFCSLCVAEIGEFNTYKMMKKNVREVGDTIS